MSGRTNMRAIFAACLLALAGAATAIAAVQVVGIAAAVVKDVRIKPVGAAQPAPARVRQRIGMGDQVQTGAASHLQALLLDKSTFTVGPNARLTVDRFVYSPTGGSDFSATLAKGAFRFMSGRPGQDRKSSITTPVASIGIRGTVLDTIVGEEAVAIAKGERAIGNQAVHDPETATLVVLRGPGARTTGGVEVGAASVTAAGQTVELDRPMQASYVPAPGMPPIGPFTLSRPGLGRLGGQIMPRRKAILPDNPPSAYSPPPRSRARPPGDVGLPVLPPGVVPGGQSPSGPGGWGNYGPGSIGTPAFPPPRTGNTRQPPRETPQGQTQPQPQPQRQPQGQQAPADSAPPPQTSQSAPPPTASDAPPPADSAAGQQPQSGGQYPLR
jgi:hypothetical protein